MCYTITIQYSCGHDGSEGSAIKDHPGARCAVPRRIYESRPYKCTACRHIPDMNVVKGLAEDDVDESALMQLAVGRSFDHLGSLTLC